MADTTTQTKIYNHNLSQRIEASDLNEISEQTATLDEELAWALLSSFNGVIDGFQVAHKSDRDFYVYRGTGLYYGKILKDVQDPAPLEVTLDANGDANPRIDVIYIAGQKKTASDNASKVILSGYTRVPLSAQALGVGDGSTKTFDLPQPRVDIRTLKVKIAGVQVGGWSLSPATGAGGVDQVIFTTPVTSGKAITADFTHESGGVEGNASVPTRQTLAPDIRVAKGTPAASPSAPISPPTAEHIPLAHITVPGSWSGGAPTSIDNTVKNFLLHPDANVDPGVNVSSVPPSPTSARSGRVASLIRHMDQVLVGGRLRYSATDIIKATTLWGTLAGSSVHSKEDDVELTLQSSAPGSPGYVDAAGWWYVYLTQALDVLPGEKPSLFVSQSPPNSRRRESGTNSGLYVGAIFLNSFSPVSIRPFYTHGPWTFWESPTGISVSGDGDVNVSDWCPETGRLLNAWLIVSVQPASLGEYINVTAKSHKTATGKDWPQFGAAAVSASTGVSAVGSGQGVVRAEDDAGTRYVHVGHFVEGTPTSTTAGLHIQGYLDDHRTMDDTTLSDASPTFY